MEFSTDMHGPQRMNCHDFDPFVGYVYPNIIYVRMLECQLYFVFSDN